MIVNYTYYLANGFEEIDERTFNRLNKDAERMVHYFTSDKIRKLEVIPIEVKDCISEVIEYLAKIKTKKDALESTANEARIASETVGGHSVTYKYGDEINKNKSTLEVDDQAIYDICLKHLLYVKNLMYRGR